MGEKYKQSDISVMEKIELILFNAVLNASFLYSPTNMAKLVTPDSGTYEVSIKVTTWFHLKIGNQKLLFLGLSVYQFGRI
jgi:hypothetical protein